MEQITDERECPGPGLDTAVDPAPAEEILAAAGYTYCDAWVRAKRPPTQNALKQARKRKKQLAEGLTQVNVVVPQEHKAALLQIAYGLRQGDVLEQVLAAHIGVPLIPPHLTHLTWQLLNQIKQGTSRLDALRFLIAEEKAGRLD